MKHYLTLLLALVSGIALAQEPVAAPAPKVKLEKCEPSLLINIGGGPTRMDGNWKGEFTLDVAFGCQFRNGHAIYAGASMQKMDRTVTRRDTYQDLRTSRTNMPIYLEYQWRAFGWHQGMGDAHRWSPFVGVKAGWNFVQDIHVNETVEGQNEMEAHNQEFIIPHVGIDVRCAEYLCLGIMAECEISKRYTERGGGSYFKPRFSLVFKI